MFWTIAKREILDNLMSLKFLLGTVLCLALVVIGTVVSLQDYQTRMEEYDRTVAVLNEKSQYDRVWIVRKPEVLSIFAHGFDKRLGGVAYSGASIPANARPMGEETMYQLLGCCDFSGRTGCKTACTKSLSCARFVLFCEEDL